MAAKKEIEMDPRLTKLNEFLNSQSELCKDSENMLEIFPYILKLQNEKGLIYGRSWCKHSDTSAFFNLERKFDRIENIMTKALEEGVDKTLHSEESSTPTETFMDTVVDCGVYALMWAGYIKENHPDEWEKFKNFNNLEI